MTKFEYKNWLERPSTKKVMALKQVEIDHWKHLLLNGIPLVNKRVDPLTEYARMVGILYGLEFLDEAILERLEDDKEEDNADNSG